LSALLTCDMMARSTQSVCPYLMSILMWPKSGQDWIGFKMPMKKNIPIDWMPA